MILAFLIILSGVFFFPMSSESNLTHTPQIAWLVFSAGLMFSAVLWEKDKWISLLFGIILISFLRTILLGLAPKILLFEGMFISFAAAMVYYATRNLNLNENTLRWFLIPAGLNILLVFIQKFFPQIIPLQSKEICGFLGNAGLTATFLGMTTPIFIKHLKAGLPFLLAAILLCQGFVGLLAFMVCCLFYVKAHSQLIPVKNPKYVFYALLAAIVGTFIFIGFHYSGQVMLRASMAAGTLSGILYHPFLGWGPGSFAPTMERVPMEESVYLGTAFNSRTYIMNHPANEFLFGWWNFGLAFFVISLGYVWKILSDYNPEKTMSFTILLAGLVVMLFFFFTPPTLFLMALALGIYQNTNGGGYDTV